LLGETPWINVIPHSPAAHARLVSFYCAPRRKDFFYLHPYGVLVWAMREGFSLSSAPVKLKLTSFYLSY